MPGTSARQHGRTPTSRDTRCMKRSNRCGNPDCPSQPEIVPDDSSASAEARVPCPDCGSKSRAVSIGVTDTAMATDKVSTIVKAQVAAGRGTAFYAEVLTTTATIPDTQPRLSLLGLDIRHEIIVRYSDLQDDPDGPCVIEVLIASTGAVIVSGVGETAGDALADVFEHMLPPDSQEYIDPEDA